MEQEATAIEPSMSPEEKRLQRMERTQWIQGIIMIVFLILFTIGIFSVNTTLREATQGVPELVETAQSSLETTTEELQTLIDELNSIDFKQLEQTVEQAGNNVNSIDMEALNNSIQNLERVVNGLASIFGGR